MPRVANSGTKIDDRARLARLDQSANLARLNLPRPIFPTRNIVPDTFFGQAYRFNDDGEPSSSAGKPILAAIDGQGFDRAVVVVTRWFGGIKLGVGGLIRAYGGTATKCLPQAARQPIVHVTRMTLRCDFGQWSLLEGRIRERGTAIEKTIYGALAVEAILAVPSRQESEIAKLVADATQGRGNLVALPEDYP